MGKKKKEKKSGIYEKTSLLVNTPISNKSLPTLDAVTQPAVTRPFHLGCLFLEKEETEMFKVTSLWPFTALLVYILGFSKCSQMLRI